MWKEHIGTEATHIFCTNKEVGAHNAKCIKDLGVPIVCINALHTGRGHAASTDDVEGTGTRARVETFLNKIVLRLSATRSTKSVFNRLAQRQ